MHNVDAELDGVDYQQNGADRQEDGEHPLRHIQRESALAVCHLGHNLLPTGVEKEDPEYGVDNGDDCDKHFLAGNIQTVEHQRETDEASFTRAKAAAHHDKENKEVDNQFLGPCKLAVAAIANNYVYKGVLLIKTPLKHFLLPLTIQLKNED